MSLAWTLQIPTCFTCCICHAFASAFKKHMFTHFLGTYALQRSPRYDMSRGKLPLLANKATWSHWSIDWCCWNLANSFIINQWLDLRGSIWWEHSFIASNLDSWILIVNTNPTSSPSHVQQSPSACPRRFFVFLFHVHWSLRHSHLPLVMGRHWCKPLLPLKAHDLLIHHIRRLSHKPLRNIKPKMIPQVGASPQTSTRSTKGTEVCLLSEHQLKWSKSRRNKHAHRVQGWLLRNNSSAVMENTAAPGITDCSPKTHCNYRSGNSRGPVLQCAREMLTVSTYCNKEEHHYSVAGWTIIVGLTAKQNVIII